MCKNLFLAFLICVTIVTVTSCSTSSKVAKAPALPSEATSFVIFKPLVFISVSTMGMKPVLKSEVSDIVSNSIFNNVDKKIPSQFKRIRYIPTKDNAKVLVKEMLSIVDSAENNKPLNMIKVSKFILHVLDSLDCNAGIGCIEVGYIPSALRGTNMGNNLMPMGDHLEVAGQNYSSKLAYFIIDRKNKNISFYNKNADDTKNPLNYLDTQKQTDKILNTFFKL